MSAEPVSPSLKDLPNLNNDLKSQLINFNQEKLKDVDVQEKIILPTAQGMTANLFFFLQDSRCFFSLLFLHVFLDYFAFLVDITQERVHTNLIQGVESFKTDQLKRTNTLEKVVLPNAEGMFFFICVLRLSTAPSFLYVSVWLFVIFEFFFCIDVATEKSQKALFEGVEAFDTRKLKPTETHEKNPLPDKTGKRRNEFGWKFMHGDLYFDQLVINWCSLLWCLK